MDKVFTKKEVIDLYDKEASVGRGAFGCVKELEYFTLIKTYSADTKDLTNILVPAKFDSLKKEEVERKKKFPNNLTREERILKAKKRLSITKYGWDLIKGLAYYHEYAFGTLLNYYRYMEELGKCTKNLTEEEKEEVCHNLDLLIDDFHKNYIYPMDIKGSNIMINTHTLDVKMIDLEDKCVYYMDSADEQKKIVSKVRMESTKKRLQLKK